MEPMNNELSNAFIIMDPNNSEGDSNVLLLKDMMLDEQEQQCILEVYSEAPNDEFALPDFPDEIHIDINMDPEEMSFLDEASVMPKRVTAANQVLPLLTSVYEDRGLDDETGLASEWRSVFQTLSSGDPRDNCECKLCGCSFVTPSRLFSHAVEVHGELDLKGLQQCFVCRKSYVFSSALNLHLEQHHGLPMPHMTCSVCFTQLNSRSELKAHLRKHDLSESCKMCFGRFPSRHQLAQHVDSAHAKPFPCSHCRSSFSHQAAYRRHYNRHQNFALSSCAKCGWRPDQAVDPELVLLEHLHACQSPEQLQTFISFMLEEDKKEAQLEPLLDSYFKFSQIGANQQNAPVETCLLDIISAVENEIGDSSSFKSPGMEFDNQESYCKLCRRSVTELELIPNHVQECHPKSKQCPICRKRFHSVKRAQAHTKLHLAKEPVPKEYKCNYCEKLFSNTGKLNRHIESVHSVKVLDRPFDCHICKKQFQSATIRDRHVVTHNVQGSSNLNASLPAPLKCSYCSSTFIKASFLSKHTEKYHSKSNIISEKNYDNEEKLLSFECKICGEGLESLSKLKSHIMYNHGAASVKNRFKCTFCDVGCRTAVGLKVHMRTHTNERPYQCHLCDKTFKRMQALNEHQKRMHNSTSEAESERPICKLFCCPEKDCPLRQTKKNTILKHYLRIHRNLRRFICGFCGESYCQNQELKAHMMNKHDLVAPNVAVKDTSKLTDIYVFPLIEKLPSSHPHSMLISQIMDDQKKKTENIPEFPVVHEKSSPKKSKFLKKIDAIKEREKDGEARLAAAMEVQKEPKPEHQQKECEMPNGETIIYDNSGVFHPVVPDLEAIAAPNTESSLSSLTSMNNETYLNILSKAYEKIKPQFSEMVAVVNIPPKNPEISVVSVPLQEELVKPILISAASNSRIVIQAKTDDVAKTDSKPSTSFAVPQIFPFKCDMPDCHKTFGDGAKLLRHKKTHTDLRPFECATCLKTFREKSNLVVHMRTHSKEKPYSCEECSKSFRYMQEFKRHKMEHSGETFSYPCLHCPDRVFKRIKDLNRHVRTHLNDAPGFECKICGTVLSRKDTLLLHQARKHGGDQFKCGVCNKSFALEQQLKTHKNIHSGIKEHKCDICGRSFALRSYLLGHLKRHEKQKQYLQCTLCPRKFSSQQTMEVHQSSFHAKGAMLHRRQQKQEALQRQEDARRAALAAALEEDMLHVDFDLDDDPNSQVVYLQVLSDADLALLPP